MNVRKTRPSGEPRAGPPAEQTEGSSLPKRLLCLLLKIAAMVGIVMLALTFLYGLHRNQDPDMNPAVKDGDLVVFYRLDKDYAAGDLLLVDFEGRRQVRRVVAIAGDTVDITEEGLVINGALQPERTIYEETRRYADGAPLPVTLGDDTVFVLGDARENATDSRVYGAIDTDDTLGTAIAIIRRRNM